MGYLSTKLPRFDPLLCGARWPCGFLMGCWGACGLPPAPWGFGAWVWSSGSWGGAGLFPRWRFGRLWGFGGVGPSVGGSCLSLPTVCPAAPPLLLPPRPPSPSPCGGLWASGRPGVCRWVLVAPREGGETLVPQHVGSSPRSGGAAAEILMEWGVPAVGVAWYQSCLLRWSGAWGLCRGLAGLVPWGTLWSSH